ncbi:camp-regulated phosphoprotein family protein Igo1 [Penicillium nucicola]|uniref:camp-regulated phosphoprotein family protein Igo1 n=1 Tax=Penicillium nucicola TaxID=1850975 RepID=UPI0025458862|nr:camp-regulated phosphoprotein family protein Igo1 [Penicillium nucicola]KAJ5747740.1 camp-regulated phosphoprotein family protein Igo1 [Penicillium nucicola]
MSEQQKKLAQSKIASRYGIVPLREKLFPEESMNRTYFDSGEFALNNAHKSSEISPSLGTKHPQRSNISHPFCAVPSSSNVCEEANDPIQAPKERHQSHLQDSDCQEEEA